MSAQVAADLRAAADVLERDGWTQFTYHSSCGHCALGAVVVAATGRNLDPDEDIEVWTDRYRDAVRALEQYTGRHTPSWNDSAETTAAEVVATFRAAADRAEATQ